MAARGCEDLFNFTEMDAGSPDLYAATGAKVCNRSAKQLLRETYCPDTSSTLWETSDGDCLEMAPVSELLGPAAADPTHVEDGAAGAERILDIGCGTGETTRLLLAAWPRAIEVLGVDKSAQFLDYAAARSLADGEDRLSFNLLDAESDVWPTNWTCRFTKVFSNYALHWIKDHRRLMANVARSLAPGGELIAQFFHSTSRAADGEIAAAKMAAEELGCGALLQQFIGNRRVEQEWKNPDNYCNLVTSLGLTVRRCAVVERTVHLESRLERAGMALSVNPLVALLPEHLRTRFALLYVQRLRDPYTITHNVVVLHAVKPQAAGAANCPAV